MDDQEMLGPTGAITISIVFCGGFYLAMGFCGFIKYGLDTQPSISLNLPSGNHLAQTCQAMFAIAVYFSYALQFYVVMDIIRNSLIRNYVHEKWSLCMEFVVMFLLNILICNFFHSFFNYICSVFVVGLAATVPWMDLLVSLISCLTISTLSIMVPAMIDTALYWKTESGSRWFYLRLLKNVFIFCAGFLAFIVGSYMSLSDIIKKFKSGPD